MKKVCKAIMFKNILFIVLLALIFIISGCSNNSIFSGSKMLNDNQFLVDFDILNTTVSGKIYLTKGEAIKTIIDIKKGDAGIVIKNENNRVVYHSDNTGCSNFIIKIEETGAYNFHVTGFIAQGSIYFIKTLSGFEKEH